MPEKWRQLVAVRPVYGDRGNACELWLRDGRGGIGEQKH